MNPLLVFLCIIALMAAGLVWFAHKADLGDTLAEHAKLYVRPYVKGTMLITIAAVSAFDEAFRNLTPEVAAAMTWWQWASLYFKPYLAGGAVLVAFLDRSIAEAQAAPAAPSPEPPPAPLVIPPAPPEPFAKQ